MIHIGLALMGAFPEFVSVYYYYYYYHREQQFVHVLAFLFSFHFKRATSTRSLIDGRGTREITEPRTFAAYACTVTLAVMNFLAAP